MRIRRVWIEFWLVLMLQEGGVFEDVYLTPYIAEVFEHENVTITLLHPDKGNSISLWNRTVLVRNTNGTCTVDGSFASLIQYEVMCNTTADSVTLLNVTRDKHLTKLNVALFATTDTFFCTIHVNVAVENVDIFTRASGTTITVNENESIHIRCVSSFCRPNANISLHVSEGSTDVLPGLISETNYIANTASLVQTETNFTLMAKKYFNSRQIYCSARNDPEKEASSSKYELNILYPPSSPAEVGAYQNMSVYRIREFTTRRLNCTVKESNPPSTVEWECEQAVYTQNNISNWQKELVFNVSRGTNASCACSYTYRESQKVKSLIQFDVLYPPDKIYVDLYLEGSLYQNISSAFEVTENKILLFNCSGNGNPNPDRFQWSGANYSSTDRLYLRPYRHQQNSTMTCLVLNTMNETEENSVSTGNHSQTYRLNVLYRPSIRQMRNYSVLEGNAFNTTCKLEPGRTTNQSVMWLKESKQVSASSDLHILNTTRTKSGTYICQLDLTMKPTYGPEVTEVHTRSFFIDVLFPPENIEIQMSLGQRKYDKISDMFSVIENKTSNMILYCFASANPLPTNFSWEGSVNNDSAILQLIPTRNITGKYTCSVNNTMFITYATNESKVGTASSIYYIDVLYPPSIQQHPNHTVLEGTDYETACITEDGRTTTQSLKWLSEFTQKDNSSVLSILNIQRNYSGIFMCQQNFTMKPTYGDTVDDSHSMVFFLDVLYPPENVKVSLSIGSEVYEDIEKNIFLIENVTAILNCSANGNPQPTAFWFGHSSTALKILELNVSRIVTGSYRCVAKNTMNLTYVGETRIGEESKQYSIYVLYPPLFEENDRYDVIEWHDINIDCFKPGMTSSQKIRWIESKTNSELGGNNTLILSSVTRNTSESITCELNYTMKPTYGEGIQKEHNKTFKLNVLYPPENFSVDVRGILSQEVTIPAILTVIESDIRELEFICTASANPSPRNVSWTGPRESHTSHLYIKASRNFSGTYTCHAKNQMAPTTGYLQTGYRNRSYSIDFLYPPKLRGYKEENVTIGTTIVRDCIEEPGNTNRLTVCWTGGNNELRQCNQTLTILNANANDSGLYNCTVHFVMLPTYGVGISLSISTHLFINVLAESNIEHVRDGPRSSAAAVGGALAGVAVIIAVIGTLYFVKKRRLLSRKDKGAPVYENTGFAQDVVRNPYEEISNTYEGLTRTGTQTAIDHQYEKLQSFRNRQLEQQKMYENLQMNQLN